MELLVAMAVAAVLASLAVAAYGHSVAKSRRADAKTALLDLAAREERYYTTNNAYTNVAANLGYGTFPVAVPGGAAQATYVLSVTAATATSFTAQAVRAGAQATDECGDYTIDDRGQQGNANNAQPSASCW